MSLIHDYRYNLRLLGAESWVLPDFQKTFEQTLLVDYMAQDPNDPFLFTSTAVQGNGGLEEDKIEDALHKLAMHYPMLTLQFQARDLQDLDYGFELQLSNDTFQRAQLVSYVSEFPPPVPFAERNAQKAPAQTVSMLCQEYEDDDGFRHFDILAVSEDKASLQKLMRAKIEQDDNGMIANNGIEEDNDTYFKTNYENGFVEYYIINREVLDRDAIHQLLQTKEYDTTFYYPENLPEVLKQGIQEYAETNHYVGVNIDPVASFLMNDKRFHALVKDTFWGDEPTLKDYRISQAIGDIVDFLEERMENEPLFLVDVGGLHQVRYPDNLRDILISSIYNVARNYQLPVKDAGDQADKIMLNPAFQSRYLTLPETSHLQQGSDAFQMASLCCDDFVTELMVPELAKTRRSSFDALLQNAEAQKPSAQSKMQNDPPSKEPEEPQR